MNAIRMLLAVALFSGCANAEKTAQADQGTVEQFHTDTIKLAGDSNRAISPDVIATANPHVRPYAAIVDAARWTQKNVPVCWENPQATFANEMQWTRDAIAKTWETHSKLRFTGWQPCAAINNGIRIQINDSGPHVKQLGRLLNGLKNGMVLNFTFQNWSPDCAGAQRQSCIRSIAVHEFGHAIAFTHEQNRADAPGECKLLAQGTAPDRMLTPYDAESVMNYCNKKWNNDGFLSDLDINAVQVVYGKP